MQAKSFPGPPPRPGSHGPRGTHPGEFLHQTVGVARSDPPLYSNAGCLQAPVPRVALGCNFLPRFRRWQSLPGTFVMFGDVVDNDHPNPLILKSRCQSMTHEPLYLQRMSPPRGRPQKLRFSDNGETLCLTWEKPSPHCEFRRGPAQRGTILSTRRVDGTYTGVTFL